MISGPDGVRLPPLYSLFGEVVSGLDVVEAIDGIGSRSGAPTEPVVIESVTIEEKDSRAQPSSAARPSVGVPPTKTAASPLPRTARSRRRP